MSDQNPGKSAPNSVQTSDPNPSSNVREICEQTHDKTLADSFPTSDPPSSIPDPTGDEAAALSMVSEEDELLQDLAPGSWAAVSLDRKQILGVGRTADEATEAARRKGHFQVQLLQVAQDPDAPLQAA